MRFLLIAVIFFVCSGCAVFNRNNTPLLNAIEKHALPKTQPARALSYPVLIPVSLAAVTLDAVIIHPATVTADAWKDTEDILWDNIKWNEHYVTSAGSLVPRAALTPVVTTFAFLGRSTFDIKPRGGNVAKYGRETQRNAEEEERLRLKELASDDLIRKAEEALRDKRLEDARKAAEEAAKLSAKNSKRANLIKCQVFLELHDVQAFAALGLNWNNIKEDPAVVERIVGILQKGTSPEQMRLLNYLGKSHMDTRHEQSYRPVFNAVTNIITSGDKGVAVRAVQVMGGWKSDSEALSFLKETAAGVDPVLAVVAESVMK